MHCRHRVQVARRHAGRRYAVLEVSGLPELPEHRGIHNKAAAFDRCSGRNSGQTAVFSEIMWQIDEIHLNWQKLRETGGKKVTTNASRVKNASGDILAEICTFMPFLAWQYFIA